MYALEKKEITSEDGHTWLIDGYYQNQRTVTTRKKILFWTRTSTYNEQQLYVHCDFIWAGSPSDNVWYLYGIFNTQEGYNLNYKLSTFCNIYPK